MKGRELLARLASGALQNVGFAEFTGLVRAFGFRLVRTGGSNHIYVRDGVSELVDLQ